LAPLAAFEGRRTVSVHKTADATVTLTLERGVLRAVAAEAPAARLLIEGEEQAVRETALLIAAAVPARVPTASLAAEAVALATGAPPAPRRAGAPALPPGELSVPQALAHVLGHLTDVILAHAPNMAAGPEAVHQMRVAVRRARSAVAIFRPALGAGALDPVRAHLRTLNARLGPTRDWDVFVLETAPAIQAALPGDERLARMAAAAERKRRESQRALSGWVESAEFRAVMIDLAWFAAAARWHPPADPEQPPASLPVSLAAFASGVLQQRWKRLVQSGRHMEELDVPALHGVRLRAKQTRYAAEMFSALHHGKAAGRFIRRLGILQQRLGVLNDGAVATHLLDLLGGPAGRHGYAAGAVAGYMAARAEKIRPQIVRAFQKFRRQPVYWA
jgi:hypothetical protein